MRISARGEYAIKAVLDLALHRDRDLVPIQEVAARTNGDVKLSAGTLYRSIQRMLEQGLLEEVRQRPAPELDDERRRYYRITAFGTAVARAEAQRLTDLVKLARISGFVPRRAQ